MANVFVVPVTGRTVPDPEHDFKPLPEGGREVPRNTYWLRALSAGDVTEKLSAKSTSKKDEK